MNVLEVEWLDFFSHCKCHTTNKGNVFVTQSAALNNDVMVATAVVVEVEQGVTFSHWSHSFHFN